MDPNQALWNARAAARGIESAHNDKEFETAAMDLYEVFDALDEWLSKGGFLPTPWNPRAHLKVVK